MQISRILRPDESIFFIICGCLLTNVAWKLLHASSNFLSPLSILETTNSSSESSEDQANTRNVPWYSGNQFLPSNPDENECNCADFVPTDESPPRPENALISDLKFIVRLLEKILKAILKATEKLLLTILLNIYKSLHKYCDVSKQIETVESLRNFLSESRVGLNLKMNNSSDQSEDIKETLNKQPSISTGSANKISFQEYLSKFLSKDIDQSEEKFNNEGTTKKNNVEAARNQREKCSEDMCDRKNDDVTWNDNDLPSHKFGSRTETARCNADDNSGSSDMKIKGNAESLLIRSLAEMFLASILRNSNVFRAQIEEINECSMKEEKKASDVSLDDESRSKNLAVKFERHLTLAEESDKICSEVQDDYPGKQSGMLPEKEANLLEEEAVMHSNKEVTQCRAEELEEGAEVGPPPNESPTKDSRESEVAGLSDSPASDHGREEEDLNAIVRRMIIVELKKHRKKEKIVLKRAHSDTETVIPRKKQNAKSRTGLFNLKGRTFFRDLLELEESLRKNSEESCDSSKINFDEGVMSQGEISSRNDVNTSVATDCTHAPQTSVGTVCEINSKIKLKRKMDLPCLMNIEIEERATDFEKISEAMLPKEECKSTQTEHVYVIRSVRSCPLRKRRVALQLQLHLLTDREPYFSTIVYANRDLSRFIYRKASDDLIYEKGKGSRSPSYVPAPERFRWKYLMPNKVQ
ncbi:uncharacterized protein LOC143264077 [Megachile rotundata]|uniref:uncharacterized protein LOC143264077 n=1 Tax=Megachile rotundata TaxID=143995 RepID=UPI003FD57EA7